MSSALAHELVSEQDFLAMPESQDHVEFIRGEIVVSPSPDPIHQSFVLEIGYRLRSWAAARSPQPFVGLSPLDVRLAPGVIVQPDLFLVLAGRPDLSQHPLEVVPDLCVEVLSGRRFYDRVAKRALYAEAGVREYWIVWRHGVVERLHGTALAEVEEVTGELRSPLLPGLSLSVPEVRAAVTG